MAAHFYHLLLQTLREHEKETIDFIVNFMGTRQACQKRKKGSGATSLDIYQIEHIRVVKNDEGFKYLWLPLPKATLFPNKAIRKVTLVVKGC